MKHYLLEKGQWVNAEHCECSAETCLQWFDFNHEENDWAQTMQQLIGMEVHENHIKDSLNLHHSPKCEIGSEYEFLIMPGLVISQMPHLNFVSCSFFLTETLLVSIRHAQSVESSVILERIAQRKSKAPPSIASLLHVLLNNMINKQMDARTEFASIMEGWQKRLITKKSHKDKWEVYFDLQRQINLFLNSCELQSDVLLEWQNETGIDLSEHEHVRFRDLIEHLDRVGRHLKDLRSDSDNLLQIYFSVTQEKTSQTVQVLTIISVIFLPLSLVAGLFGMNFNNIPFRQVPWAFGFTVTSMVVFALLFFALLKYRLRVR